jgi:HEAT repeat protein
VLEVAFVALAVASGGGALWLYARARYERREVWRSASESAGLRDLAIENAVWGQLLTARSDRLRVRIMSHQRDRDHPETRIVVDDPGNGLGGVLLRPEGATLFGSAEIEVGDPGFDEAFFISGVPALAYAFLDTRTRGTLFRMNDQGRLEIASAELRWDVPETEESRLLAKELEALLEVARRLACRTETAERLAANALHDLHPGVRLRNLLCLIREFSEHPVVDETLRAACADRSPEVRLRAATALGGDGVETLLAMTDDLGLADVWQAAAVSALGRRLPVEGAVEGLERALGSHHFETARACIETLAAGGEAAVAPLVKALAVDRGIVAASAATALGALQAPEAETPLIRALWREAPGLRVAAAEALGRSGSTAAVLPLKQAADRYPEAAFRRAARQAIAEIQARLPGASPGQLSLAAPESGQLSLADAEAGRLSLAEGEAGQLSFAEGRLPEPRSKG